MKYLLPLARANGEHARKLVAGLGEHRLSVRQVGRLYAAYRVADTVGRARICASPLLFLQWTRRASARLRCSPPAWIVWFQISALLQDCADAPVVGHAPGSPSRKWLWRKTELWPRWRRHEGRLRCSRRSSGGDSTMIDPDPRIAIFALRRQGKGIRTIARALGISRNTVREIVGSGQVAVPERESTDKTEPHAELLRELYQRCAGNRVRVAEELAAQEIAIPYSTLTAGLRRLGVGVRVKEPAGEYIFDPGVEMQHDTSPHDIEIGGRRREAQTASLVHGYSRMRLMQSYPVWNRFWCKVFLTDALVFLGGAAGRCMVDNSSVVLARGSGKNATIAPEMEAFSRRFGFVFAAHELGDANRSAKVERPFSHYQNNFLAGRTFTDWDDLNRRARQWCERKAANFASACKAAPLSFGPLSGPRCNHCRSMSPRCTHWTVVLSITRVTSAWRAIATPRPRRCSVKSSKCAPTKTK